MLVILMKDVLCVLAGGEPDLGGALCFCLLCFLFFSPFFVLSVESPREHDSDTITAVDEVRKTRLTKTRRRRQTVASYQANYS